MANETPTLLIIGAGPGGYVAAIRAAQRGARVTLVSDAPPGGVCLHLGCIPTKALLASAEALRTVQRASDFGVDAASVSAGPRLAADAMLRRARKVTGAVTKGLEFLFRKNGIQFVSGRAQLLGGGRVQVGDNVLTASHIILATGSRPAPSPKGLPPVDGQRIINSNHALHLAEPPKKLLIIGGGYIGCEFACIFRALGSEVTVVEALANLLPGMDAELGAAMARFFRKAGIEVRTGETMSEFDPGFDRVLISVGRVPNTGDIGCDAAGVKLTARGHVEVNDRMETSAPGIYAIGDIVGRFPLAHVASAQARVAVANAFGESSTMDYTAAPGVVFTHPEVASVGLNEAEAQAQGRAVRVGKFPMAALGRAQASGETDGFVKLVIDAETHRVLGGQIIGPAAGELIAAITLAISLGATAEQVAHTIFSHPTYAEAIGEAAEAAFGSPVHIYLPKRV
ncbi:MAG: dihydrolipoyl dehydrogenase [Verrucomicrobia bacterium]|nr:dihydrolipoyl dehydrogenase [Verrucomicrobiota bacterium]